MKILFIWFKENRWIEYLAGIAVCAGLWMGEFIDHVTLPIRIGQMALMIVGLAICCVCEFVVRKKELSDKEAKKKAYVDSKCYLPSYFSMLAVYGVIIVYCAAFEKDTLMLVMLAVLFINIIINGMLNKRFSAEYEQKNK